MDRELRYATYTAHPIGRCCATLQRSLKGSAHAPPINGVGADCDSQPEKEIKRHFLLRPASLAAQQRPIILVSFLTILARVQGNIATLTERTLINFVSGVIVVTCILYISLYLTGSLNPGDKPIIDFKGLGEKLLKGKSGE